MPATTMSELMVLFFSDIVSSVQAKSTLGTPAYAALLARHDQLFKQIVSSIPDASILKDMGDGFLARFPSASDAVRAALRFQSGLCQQSNDLQAIPVRIGIHLGEVTSGGVESDGRPKLVGLSLDLAARVMSLAAPRQILLTRSAFDQAREFVDVYPTAVNAPSPSLKWLAHGCYLLKGIEEPIEIFEVGGEGVAPLVAPANSEKGRRSVSAEDEAMLGWRPAAGLVIPGRSNWLLEKKLGEGGFGEVWLARQRKLSQKRVFKFCFDAQRLRSFKREMTLFRLLREALGERTDIARLYEVKLDTPPYLLESEYTQGGNLGEWAERQGGIKTLTLVDRLELVAQTAEAVAAAHSVGVLHKDLKPSNILIHDEDGRPHPRLADFGIGVLADHDQLQKRAITETGFTLITNNDSSRTGTRMYAPPESLSGKPFTVQGDVYALGVLLYQMVVGDLERPLAAGWERDIDDELLREDIAICVDGDPARRLPSAAELATRLRALETRRETRQQAAAVARSAARRKRWLRAVEVAAATLIVLTGLSIFGLLHERRMKDHIADAQRATARERDRAEGNATEARTNAALAERKGEEARKNADDARKNAEDARKNADEAKASERLAETRLAEGLLHAGDSYVNLQDCSAAREVFLGARDAARNAGLPEIGATSGFWAAFAAGSPPLMGSDGQRVGVGGFRGHTGGIRSVAISSDGRTAVSVSNDTTLKLWDLSTGRELRTLLGHTGGVRSVAISPDARTAVSASNDKTLKLWDLSTGNELRTFSGHTAAVSCVSISPDARTAVSASEDKTLKVWELSTGTELRTFNGHSMNIWSVAISSDGRTAISASDDRTLILWDLTTGSEIRTFSGHTGGVASVAISPDGQMVLSAGNDPTLRLWELSSGRAIRTFNSQTNQIKSVAITPDGRFALSASSDKAIKLWDLSAGREIGGFSGHTAPLFGVAISPDGHVAVSAGEDRTIRLWDLSTPRAVRTLSGHTGRVQSVAVSPDGRTAVSACADKTLKLWDLYTGRELRTLSGQTQSVLCVAISPDGLTALSAGADQLLTLWDLSSGQEIRTLSGHTERVVAVAITPDGRSVLSASWDKTLKLWDLSTGRHIRTFNGHADRVLSVAVSPDGQTALSGSGDGAMKLWNLASGQEVCSFDGHTGGAYSVAFSPNGRTALSGGRDSTLKLWDLVSRRELRTFSGHANAVTSVAITPDGRAGFSASEDMTLKLWDLSTGRELRTFRGHTSWVRSVVISADGYTTVSAGDDTTLKLWDVSSPDEYLKLEREVADARQALDKESANPAALATFGRWYAFRGKYDWAAEFFEKARAGGAEISPLALARCYWQQDKLPDARREFQTAIERKEAREVYLRQCIGAVEAEIANPKPTKPVKVRLTALTFAPRPTEAKPGMIDLTRHYNAHLDEAWHDQGIGANHLGSLPTGIQTFAGTQFDVRGVVQLAGLELNKKADYPESVGPISVGRKCRKLHFLHAAGWTLKDDTEIERCTFLYANGARVELPILYGQDLRDWTPSSDPVEKADAAVTAWTGRNDRAAIRLFKRTWDNPFPDVAIESIEFRSAMTKCAPFLIAITVE